MVSVIVPVYNSEKWIERCILSILEQTYRDLELLLIDDGSADSSRKIIDGYSGRDSRVRVVKNTNHGPGYSRNIGIELAGGEYVVFVDSDDFIKKNYLETLIQAVNGDKLDLVISAYQEVEEIEGKPVIQNMHRLSKKVISSLTGDIEADFYKIRDYVNSPCLKLFRTSILKEFSVRFPEDMISGEDLVFNLRYFNHIRRYRYIPYSGYYYRKNEASITHRVTLERFESMLKAFHELETYANANNVLWADRIIAEDVYRIVQQYTEMDENDSLGRYLYLADRLEEKRTFARLDNPKKTVILLLYKLHFLWIYYYVARFRRRKVKR